MKYTTFVTGGVAALLLSASFASAATVTLIDSSAQGGGNTAGLDFAVGYGANLPTGASFDVDPTVTPPPGNESGANQSPFNSNGLTDTQDYFSVGAVGSNGGATSPATLSFTESQTSINILIGSIDSYNSISFSDGTMFTGTELATLIGGGTAANFETVGLFNFQSDGFTSITFNSSQAALEFALQPVPLPAAGLLLLAGLGGLGLAKRRKG